MKIFSDNYKSRAVSVMAVIVSAAIIAGGTAAKARAYAIPDDGIREPRTVTDYGERSVGYGDFSLTENVPMTAGTAAEYYVRSVERSISVTIDGKQYNGSAFLRKDTTYVGFREFANSVAGAEITWNAGTSTATAKTSKVTVTATKGKEYIAANGRYFWAKTGIVIENGTMYVPIRAIASAFGAAVEWDGKAYSVNVKSGSGTVEAGSSYYDADSVYWLSKIIHAESRGEPMTGKIAVGNVVLNRVRSSDYPNTIYGVIFDKKYGVQFSPVADGSIRLEPDADAVIAAKLCLEGYTVSSSILFFINQNLATNMWVTNTRPLAVSIGKHDFYA